MASKPKTKSPEPLAAEPDYMASIMSRTAEIAREALLKAHREGIPLQLGIGSVRVEATSTGAILASGESRWEYAAPSSLAGAAGLLLGAAWAGEELDRG